MQNTIVGGGGSCWRKKKKLKIRGKKDEGERKREENYIKNRGKGLKNASHLISTLWGNL